MPRTAADYPPKGHKRRPAWSSVNSGVNGMKIAWKHLGIALAIPLLVGGASALTTGQSMERYAMLRQPPLSPPGWLFPVVWTALFLLMGLSSYLVWTSGGQAEAVRRALTLYGVQLAVNFLWPILFFNLGAYLLAMVWLVLLWGLIGATMLAFRRLSVKAGWMLAPYLAWVTFAGYLNLGVYLLN